MLPGGSRVPLAAPLPASLHMQEGANPVESAECVMAFAKDMLRTSKEVGRAWRDGRGSIWGLGWTQGGEEG